MKVLFQAIFLVILMISNVFAQESDVIAEANNSKITSDEFLKRFELTPRVRSSANIDTQKTHFLYTLIAEKLWAEEARSQNLDTMDSYKYYISNLEKLLVRDALFKREIEEKVRSVTGGREVQGISIIVVTPPNAAAVEACSKSSLNSKPGVSKCTCGSIAPGINKQKLPSIEFSSLVSFLYFDLNS